MNISSEIIVINYTTQQEECACCHRELENDSSSDTKTFTVSMEEIFNNVGWHEPDKIFIEEIEEFVEDFLFNTIRFYSVRSDESLLISDEEVDRVTQLVELEVNRILTQQN